MRLHSRTGQSVLEYTLILGVVIAAIVWVLLGTEEHSIQSAVKGAYESSEQALETTVGDLTSGVFQGVVLEE